MLTQAEKGAAFHALSRNGAGAFIISESMGHRHGGGCWLVWGFEALATTSAGYAFSAGANPTSTVGP